MKIITGIASTTHVDRHNDQMTKGALDGMAEQINEKYIPQLIEHDWNRHVGTLLYGEVFQLDDGEYALGIVSGLFENDNEKETFKSREPNLTWKTYKSYLNIDELLKMNKENSSEIEADSQKAPSNIADLLETHLDSTQLLPDGTVYNVKRFIAATGDLKIEVYPKDHDPEHFHVVSKQREINARFDINTLGVLNAKEKNIKAQDIKKIQNLFEQRPDLLKKLREEHRRIS